MDSISDKMIKAAVQTHVMKYTEEIQHFQKKKLKLSRIS